MKWHQGHLAADHLTSSTAFATIDLNALRHNFDVVKRHCPSQKVMAMVKSRAYGHGLISCARALSNADGFGVACLGEAIALRQAGIQQSIFLISGFHHADDLDAVVEHDLIPVLHAPWQIDILAARSLAKPLTVWMKIDTGMGRLGFLPESFMVNYQRLITIAGIEQNVGVITHLSSADDLSDPTTKQQIDRYWQLVEGCPGPKSIANSAGILHWPQAVVNTDWVRPGIMLYGAAPALGAEGSDLDLHAVMTVRAQVIAVKAMKQGDPVGYSHTWTCPEDMTVAILAYGYGDGLPRTASGLQVAHANGSASIIGRVSMDLTAIDCRGVPGVQPGDFVTVWGQGGLSVTAAARQIDEFHYELLTNVSGRVRRQYTE